MTSMGVVLTCPNCRWATKPSRAGYATAALQRHSCQTHQRRLARAARGRARTEHIDRTPQQCQHTRAKHRHGERATYVADKCRCPECAAANTAYETHRLRSHAYGRWADPTVDAEPVREHINALRRAGLGRRRIADLAQVSPGVLGRLLYGRGSAPPARRLKSSTAERLLAVRSPKLTDHAPGAVIAAVGTRRRIQALACAGWSIPQLATRCGVDRQALDRALTRDRIQARTAVAVTAVYDALWNSTPTVASPAAAAAASRTRNRARQAGWQPPMAWDDIDDVDETPGVRQSQRLSRVELVVATTVELLALGVGPAQIANRLSVKPDSLHRILQRGGRHDLTAQLIRITHQRAA